MRRLAATVLAAASLAVGTASPAWAAPTTEVVQGEVLRLVSVADWEAAGSMLAGQSVRWDVTVSADAPDPGVVTIGVSAVGEAPLILDVTLCAQEWRGDLCPSGADVLRAEWEVPRDGVEVELAEMADTEVAHVRLDVALARGEDGGSTDIRLHARGQGESITTGPGGDGLATTGMPPVVPWIFGGGVLLMLLGLALVALRRRRGGAASDARVGTDGEGGAS